MNIDITILHQAAQGIRLAQSRGAYTLEESAQLSSTVTQIEELVKSFTSVQEPEEQPESENE